MSVGRTPRVVRHSAAALAVAAAAWPAAAQTVRVRVVERATGAAVPGAIVSLLAADSARVAPGLTDADGRLALRAGAAGTYRIQVERVGFATVVTLPVELEAGRTRDQTVLLTSQTTRLAGVRVVDRQRCSADPARNAATAELWSEARKALTASELTAVARLVPVEMRRYRRALDVSMRVTDETSRARTATTGRPYVTLPPDDLAARGYLRSDGGGGEIYYAPDAGVLLSDVFVRDHCFAVAESAADTTLAGLTFRPLRVRSDLVDVSGTLWLDRETAELRHLVFRYVNLSAGRDAPGVGGRVEFVRLATGAWIVSRWHIRSPQRGSALDATTGAREYRLMGYVEDGAEVVVQGDAAGPRPAARASAVLAGVVVDSASGAALPGARLEIAGPNGTVVRDSADAAGAFRRVVEPGRHTVRVDHPLFAHPAARAEVTAEPAPGDSTHVVAFAPGAFTLAQSCGAPLPSGDEAPTGTLVGRVRDAATGAPLAYAAVTVRWTAPRPLTAGPRVRATPRGYEMRVTSDVAGRYLACRVPAQLPLVVSGAASEPADADTQVQVPRDGAVGHDVLVTTRR